MKNHLTIRELEDFKLLFDKDSKCFFVKYKDQIVFNAGLDSQAGNTWLIKNFMALKDVNLKNKILSKKHSAFRL